MTTTNSKTPPNLIRLFFNKNKRKEDHVWAIYDGKQVHHVAQVYFNTPSFTEITAGIPTATFCVSTYGKLTIKDQTATVNPIPLPITQSE